MTICKAFAALALVAACSQKDEVHQIKRRQEQTLQELARMEFTLRHTLQLLERRLPAGEGRPGSFTEEPVYAVPVEGRRATGPADAWVTVVVFAGLDDPGASALGPTLIQLRRQLGDRVRLVYRHTPRAAQGPGMDAALALECAAAQGAFWPLLDRLLARPRAACDAVDLPGEARGLGLDLDRWRTCLAVPATRALIAEDVRVAHRLGVRDAAALFVNGRLLVGAQAFDDVRRMIDRAEKIATASGLARADYYTRAVVRAGAPVLP
jgi:protein-disulfide isomerase